MKRLLLLAAIIVITIPLPLLAAPCSNTISVTNFSEEAAIAQIRNVLKDYDSYPSSDGARYELCFDGMQQKEVSNSFFSESLSLTVGSTEDKDIYISGLNIQNSTVETVDIPILVIRNAGRGQVILKNITLKKVHNGISIEKPKKFIKFTSQISSKTLREEPSVLIEKAIVQGDDSRVGKCIDIKAPRVTIESSEISSCDEGIRIAGIDALVEEGAVRDSNFCIDILADNAKVRGVDISGCGEAIGIEANKALIGAADHDHAMKKPSDMNTIHENVMGLHVVSGDYNKFGFNLIYENKVQTASEGVAQDAILLEANTNEGLVPLELIPYEVEGEEYTFRCIRNKSGQIIGREMNFSIPQQDGLVTLYKSDFNSQMNSYLTNCVVTDEGNGSSKCDIGDLPQDFLEQIPEGECGIEKTKVSALFTGTSSTELLSQSLPFKGIVAFVSNPYDIPTTGGASDVDMVSGATAEIAEEGDSDNAIAADGAAIEGSGATLASAAGGCGGGGASLANNSFRSVVFGFNAWWVLLILALAGATRLAAVKIRNRRKHR